VFVVRLKIARRGRSIRFKFVSLGKIVNLLFWRSGGFLIQQKIMAATKTVAVLALELEKLEKYLEEAVAQRDQGADVTIKVVASEDIILKENQPLFFDGLIKTLNTTIDQTKKQINDLMYPKMEMQSVER